jgi:Fur family peroxide stress response transcriptional regulator
MGTNNDFKALKLRHLETACRKQGIAITSQRRIILESLAERQDHPTADLLFEAVREQLPEVSRTTVYRVLEMLVRLGVAQLINSPLAKARFDADTERHHHMICLACNAVLDCHDPKLDSIPFPATVAAGFEIRDYSVNFTGLCADCRDKSRNMQFPSTATYEHNGNKERKEVTESRNCVNFSHLENS